MRDYASAASPPLGGRGRSSPKAKLRGAKAPPLLVNCGDALQPLSRIDNRAVVASRHGRVLERAAASVAAERPPFTQHAGLRRRHVESQSFLHGAGKQLSD